MSTLRGQIPLIDSGRCTGCGWCVPSCHLHLLTLQVVQWKKSSTLHDAAACTGCRRCEAKCPFGAITMHRPGAGTPDRSAAAAGARA